MKHIKLFEQFDDPFGEENDYWKDPEPPMKIVKYKSNNTFFIFENKYKFFKNNHYHTYPLPFYSFDLNPVINDETYITIFDEHREYNDNVKFIQIDEHNTAKGWVKCKYKDLPEEIKNRIE